MVGARRPYRWWKQRACMEENAAWGRRVLTMDQRRRLCQVEERMEIRQMKNEAAEEEEAACLRALHAAMWELDREKREKKKEQDCFDAEEERKKREAEKLEFAQQNKQIELGKLMMNLRKMNSAARAGRGSRKIGSPQTRQVGSETRRTSGCWQRRLCQRLCGRRAARLGLRAVEQWSGKPSCVIAAGSRTFAGLDVRRPRRVVWKTRSAEPTEWEMAPGRCLRENLVAQRLSRSGNVW